MQYKSHAYFIFDDDSRSIIETIESNTFHTRISSVHVNYFLEHVASLASDIEHIVLSVASEKISELLAVAYRYKFSVGIVPMPSQKVLMKNLYCSSDIADNIELALRDESVAIDAVEINGEFIYSQGIVGRAPLIGRAAIRTRHSFWESLIYAVKEFFTIELQAFEITTQNGKTITTAGSGVVVLNHTRSGLLSRIFDFDQSVRDGEVTAVIISPFSIMEYIRLLTSIFYSAKNEKTLPHAIGYIKSKRLEIAASRSTRIYFDNGKSMELPITCTIIPDALLFNASEAFWLHNEKKSSAKETVKIDNLPDKTETQKYAGKKIPFFTYASEERFRDLFQMLRSDAKVNQSYLYLMILSTLLATIGLFASSAAVIIGAMLIAPLMTPIVSLSMGLLRAETDMIQYSLVKIIIGVLLALGASSLLGMLIPYSELTSEMKARIDPTLLDLSVAVISGVAAAYSKSFKEIMQSLAGVAIAVALVPPLATAGIGLGQGNMAMFSGAFLLFFTNLVGITIAAVVTFQLLGFSNAVKSKKSVMFVFMLLLVISVPLYFSYDKMLQKHQMTQRLKERHFTVAGKEIIVGSAVAQIHGSVREIELELLVKESLGRSDLEELKEKIQQLFTHPVVIKAKVEYLL
ncbi:MAG: TIGR00341 family protein [Sulfurimonas sp.]|nr:MAG: TIGR00341 family protein [Sulfurimonas sp.]